MRIGIAELPLHSGKAPAWLFRRMVKLAREITIAIADQVGPGEMVFKLSDPFWFQAFGCLLGFDWHSSGVTTTVCGALKEGLKELGPELGLFVVGGKGRVSRQTPAEIEVICQGTGQEAAKLVSPAAWPPKWIALLFRTAIRYTIIPSSLPGKASGALFSKG